MNEPMKITKEMRDRKEERISQMIDRVLFWCESNEDIQSVEYFQNHMLPLVKEANQEVFECEADEWEESISKHMAEMPGRRYSQELADCP